MLPWEFFVFSNSHIVILLVGRIDNIKDNEERTCIEKEAPCADCFQLV